MLDPIHRAQLTHNFPYLPIATREEIVFEESTLCSTKKQSVDYKKRAGVILNKLWWFIKTYFLFLFCDKEKEDLGKKQKQLKAFFDLYWAAAKKDTQQETSHINREFNNLSTSVQKDIKQKMYELVKRELPNNSTDFYNACVEKCLKAPFDSIDKGKNQKNVKVFAKSLLSVQETYAGFSK